MFDPRKEATMLDVLVAAFVVTCCFTAITLALVVMRQESR